MKFAQDYKYRNIPFCSQCATHSKFIPVQGNRVVGAVTYDIPNSNIDPTYVATRTETKLVCSTCGSEMFKWVEKSSETGKYFDQFLSQQELQRNTENVAKGCGRILCAFLALVVLAFLLQYRIINDKNTYVTLGVPIIIYSILYPLSKLALINRAPVKYQNKIVTVGKGVNGETVSFDQKTGKIEYK
jgi:hypothetical protein